MIKICKCGKTATQRHHKFPQHKAHRERYGKLIDKEFNIDMMCHYCHSSHAKVDEIWDEERFIKELTRYVDELERYKDVFK
jgi:hypothetical protein